MTGLLAVIVLGCFLVANGTDLVRREGVRPATLLSTVLGVLLVGYAVAIVVGVGVGWIDPAASNTVLLALLALGLPAAYLSFVFVAFLLWSAVYALWSRRRARREPADVVIVLGAGLLGGERVSPLLAGRLERARELFDYAQRSNRDPILVCSGGRGGDEQRSEAEAMSQYLTDSARGRRRRPTSCRTPRPASSSRSFGKIFG